MDLGFCISNRLSLMPRLLPHAPVLRTKILTEGEWRQVLCCRRLSTKTSPCSLQECRFKSLFPIQLPANAAGEQHVLTQLLGLLAPMGANFHGVLSS